MLGPDARLDLMTRLRDALPEVAPPSTKGGRDPFRSVVSCMLSAQSLDRNTAAASRAIFTLARSPSGILDLTEAQIVDAIRPAGLYNVKARNLHRMCEALLSDHGGRVPTDREGLMSLPGVGRNCADIVLHFTFGEDTVAVDTHVHRVCNRTGLARGKTAEQTARSLAERIPDGFLGYGHLLLLTHGKTTCRARVPKCDECLLADLCEAMGLGWVMKT